MDCCCSISISGPFFSSFSLPFSLLVFVRCRRHPSLTPTPTPMDAARLTYIKTPHPHPHQKYCSRLDWTNDCLLHLFSTITFCYILRCFFAVFVCLSPLSPLIRVSVSTPFSVLRACSCLDAPWSATVVVVSYLPVSYSLCRVLHSNLKFVIRLLFLLDTYKVMLYFARCWWVFVTPLRNKYISFVFRLSSFVSHLSSRSPVRLFVPFDFSPYIDSVPFATRIKNSERDAHSDKKYIYYCRMSYIFSFLFFRFCDHYWRWLVQFLCVFERGSCDLVINAWSLELGYCRPNVDAGDAMGCGGGRRGGRRWWRGGVVVDLRI